MHWALVIDDGSANERGSVTERGVMSVPSKETLTLVIHVLSPSSSSQLQAIYVSVYPNARII